MNKDVINTKINIIDLLSCELARRLRKGLNNNFFSWKQDKYCSKTALKRQIVILRNELLELSKMLDGEE